MSPLGLGEAVTTALGLGTAVFCIQKHVEENRTQTQSNH